MKIGNTEFNFDKQGYIMGILNATPDSFSDGNKYNTVDNAINRAKQMISEGASIIDIGGESTRPNHTPITAEEEANRVVPIIRALSNMIDVPISIDTSKADVAEQAILAGASMINDVWGFKKDTNIASVAKKYNVPCCLMHNRIDRTYKNLIPDIINDLKESIKIATDAGISTDKIMIDPGIGFGKSLEQNLMVMKHLEEFNALQRPILLGTSRKSMIGLALDLPVTKRIEGTIATTVQGYIKGCRIFRVHDIKENYRALKMTVLMN